MVPLSMFVRKQINLVRSTGMRSKVLGLASIVAASAVPAFAGKTLFTVAPEGGDTLMYLVLAGVACFGTIYVRYRNKASKRGIV